MPRTFNVGAPSLFVTCTAWLAIVLTAAVGALLALNAHWWLPAAGRAWGLAGAAAALLLALMLVAAALGMWMRLDWARRLFIGLVVLAIAAHLAGLVWIVEAAPALLGGCILLGYVIVRLNSEPVRQEFA